jgi:predicted unusual protein kinase regulating ubiquinone biosynthesis (AarF/ABC1/UbiB family)
VGEGKQNGIRVGRAARVAKLGGMALRLAGDATAAAGRLGAGRAAAEAVLHRRAAATLRKAFGELKGLPMKVGQMLSYVDDMIPPEHREVYREALRELQTLTRPVRWETMERVIAEELGAPPDEIFASFDREPIAAASIGQVYRATLGDGTEVAVKVQYPAIAEAIANDLRNADTIVSAMSFVLPRVEVEQTLSNVKERLLEECDYEAEAAYQARFAALWAGDPDIRVPAVLSELSRRRVLVTELARGRSFHDIAEHGSEAARNRAGEAIFRFAFRSLYVHGLFNADPHPGNYLFDDDGRVTFLDFGCVQSFPREAREAMFRLRHAVVGGVRGPALRDAVVGAFGLPVDLDDQLWKMIEEMLAITFLPLTAAQPYRHGRSHTEQITRSTMQAKLAAVRTVFKTGIQEVKQPGLVFLSRINFGLMSLLAMLEAEGHFRAAMDAIDAEAGLEPVPLGGR